MDFVEFAIMIKAAVSNFKLESPVPWTASVGLASQSHPVASVLLKNVNECEGNNCLNQVDLP